MADISFFNLECPLCLSDYPIKKNGPNLRANPKCIHEVSGAGFDIVGLANNHIMDYGPRGLEETINSFRKEKLLTRGAAENLQKHKSHYLLQKKGTR